MKKTFIALLRGINVSGQKKIKMADLRETLTKSGLENVQTYIQSGNIIFDSEIMDVSTLEHTIYKAIVQDFGFEVPTLVVSGNDIKEVLEANPFAKKEEENKLYYVLLKQVPEKDLVAQFEELTFENEDFHVTEKCVYLMCQKGYGNAKLNNNLIERKLKVEATTRNQKTMQKLLEMTQHG
ncbi:DUF1697 domain-containing protein [Muricauda sp. CAU 1633]|uniref:DUF1697 domain-containing protein n=1 Tax=Allomuricauda sp. CAU 1633 TaxID=2816036 RepID=UPI001A8E7F91|nr:DUF1697 domain-containing protein [Muricauda sp. CAU 1633]MBO0321383.1 DUF1697 domain-containing protein [Muricauda sp. CAU 1633]